MGLRVGDVIVRLNDQSISTLSHGQAHEALNLAGNNFVLAIHRVEDTETLVEAITKDEIEPYSINLDDLPPLQPLEEILTKLTAEPVIEDPPEEEIVEESFEERIEIIEEVPDKPKDENSEEIPNQNLTDEEIAQLIIVEEELLPEKGVLGVNFKKLRPRAPLFKDSKVFEELQKEATAEPPLIQELKRSTTFLQKPERPIPKPKSATAEESTLTQPQETYKVVIKKQTKKSITERLVEKGLLEPGCVKSSDQGSEKTTPAATPDLCGRSDYGTDSRPESKAEIRELAATDVESKGQTEIIEVKNAEQEIRFENRREENLEEVESTEEELNKEFKEENQEKELSRREESLVNELPSLPQLDEQKLKELVSTEINLEKQLESVQKQLLALKQLPSEIENHLRIVSEQLYKIMELSGMRNGREESCCRCLKEEEERSRQEEERRQQQIEELECHCVRELGPGADSQQQSYASDGRRSQATDNEEIPEIVEPEYGGEPDSVELEISIKSSEEDDSRVKKYIVSYESKVEKMTREVVRSRDPSPITTQCAGSNIGDYEPDPNKNPKEQLIEELKHRQGKKRSQDLWPQAKQLELTYGRRWRCTNDFFNDDMIAEVLSSQAEVVRGKTLGVNFKKFEKTALPNFDHLMNSSVYKMIHKMEEEPKKGIPARPPKVNAAEDVLERDSPTQNTLDDVSFRSVSH
ncbi:trichohyalin-like isoform X2 [Leptopilina boulardi]|nr:trichohyalin-like isoform X2 [Leptopilina boulardi]XP_051167286.1 trichohyalin-like isoform X2 [Leptopilina boulardi]